MSSVGSGGGPRLPKKHRLGAAEVLPSLDGNLDVAGVDLDGKAAAGELLGLAPYLEIGYRHPIAGFPSPYDEESMTRLVTEVKPSLERV